MSVGGKSSRVRAPLMGVFRAAHDARDSTKREDKVDESGERVVAGRRSLNRNAISEAEMQSAVGRDIEILMNTVNLDSTEDLGDYPEVGRSILNFGLPDIVHRAVGDIGVSQVGEEIELALRTYEPRIVPGTISIAKDEREEGDHLKVRFVVRASLRYDSYNVPVEFIADLERETSKISIGRA